MTKEETARIVESAPESNFKSFVFARLLGEAEKEIASSVHAALEIAQSDDPQRFDEFVKALNFSALAQSALISKRDVEEAIYSIESFGEVVKQYETIDGMLGAMNRIDFRHRENAIARYQVRLSTIEDAKGLEYQHVFIPDCNARAFDDASQNERNLFYVAASRARDSLNISYTKGAEASFLKHFM